MDPFGLLSSWMWDVADNYRIEKEMCAVKACRYATPEISGRHEKEVQLNVHLETKSNWKDEFAEEKGLEKIINTALPSNFYKDFLPRLGVVLENVPDDVVERQARASKLSLDRLFAGLEDGTIKFRRIDEEI